MSLVLTEGERKALAYAAEVFRGTARRLRFTWPAESQSHTDQAAVIESLLARAGNEQKLHFELESED